MADAFTGAYGFVQTEIGGSPDTWGQRLNDNWDSIDSILMELVGMVAYFPSNNALDGWLKCNGQTVSRTTYDRLWTYASTSGQVAASEGAKEPGQFGPGDGATTFSLPELRGRFIRGFDDGAGVDSGRAFGTLQVSDNISHTHTMTSSAGSHDHGGATDPAGSHNHGGTTGSAGSHNHSASTSTDGAHSHIYSKGAGNDNDEGFPSENISANSSVVSTGSAGDHSHSVSINSAGDHSHSFNVDPNHTHSIASSGAHTHSIASSGTTEARPVNVALTAYIRY